ncbi:MAG: hypothetical protein C0421_01795 [Hyphomonas sp.]|uniref:GNAT family N-acetyltransferase n=1 Tax=Hyphomonas sp. TaxID=87 RepID=UPI0025BF858B|nr:GNAT family N-acetyltransferase [Hyphomonas sp.]MBA4337559.1 hypothetical protein [Hyphomonas sp.]
MFEDITTSRLLLRSYHEDDAVRYTELVNDPRVYRNVGRVRAGQTLDETRRIQSERAEKNRRGESAGRVITLSGELVGLVGGGRNAETGIFEIGYWLAPSVWGQGYATEAAGAFKQHLVDRMGARQLTAEYLADNPASGRVLGKLGFVETARGEHFCLGRDAMVPGISMAWAATRDDGGRP